MHEQEWTTTTMKLLTNGRWWQKYLLSNWGKCCLFPPPHSIPRHETRLRGDVWHFSKVINNSISKLNERLNDWLSAHTSNPMHGKFRSHMFLSEHTHLIQIQNTIKKEERWEKPQIIQLSAQKKSFFCCFAHGLLLCTRKSRGKNTKICIFWLDQ